MDIAIHHTKTIMIESLNTLFVKWWGVTPLLALTWFGDKLFLFITPVQVEGWVKLAITFVVGIIAVWYTLRKKRQSERHNEERHKQKMFEEEMEDCRKLWLSMLDAKKIPDTMTIIDFKKEHYDKIKQAFMPQKHA